MASPGIIFCQECRGDNHASWRRHEHQQKWKTNQSVKEKNNAESRAGCFWERPRPQETF